ncbi:MAG: glycosyltransferase [Propionivibrio sp.]
MKVLVINYYYAPVVDAHAYRWSQLAPYFALQGHQVEVITGRVNGLKGQDNQDGVSVTRVGLRAHTLSEGLVGTFGAAHQDVQHPLIRLKTKMSSRCRNIYRKLYWPDGLWHWLPSLAMELWKRRDKKYDLIVSYSPGFVAHLGAYLSMSMWKHRFKWIADYGDPFSTSETMQPNNFRVYRRLNTLVEDKILKAAQLVVFTNEATRQAYARSFLIEEKLRVLPHLVDVRAFYAGDRSLQNLNPDSINRLQLVYVGGFHKGVRVPDGIKLLADLLKVHLPFEFDIHVYGPDNGFDLANLLPGVIHYHGPVLRERAIEIMKSAHGLINVENTDCVMSPSKIVEYVGTGRPIINIRGNGVPSIVLDKYERLGFVISVPPDRSRIDVSKLVRFVMGVVNLQATYAEVAEVLVENSIQAVAHEYLGVIRGCDA